MTTKTPSKPLKLKRSATKQADIYMALRTHEGGEEDVALVGKCLNGKGDLVIRIPATPIYPDRPGVELRINDLSLDEVRALRDYFDGMAADIQETRV